MSNNVADLSKKEGDGEKIRVNMADAPWEQCECGGHMYESVFVFKRVSALLSPNGKELHIPMELFRCTDCGLVPKFVAANVPDLPEVLKAKPKTPGIL